jgi:DNA invertase Pin-like site-specific DNA recombinase
MAAGKFVSYLRVSTDKQGRSGLGLEAQKSAVEAYLNGGRWKLVAEYIETESGKRTDRPQLKAAMAHAKAVGATLVIAKLDRLARNLHFVSGLMEGGVDFVAADNPHANRLTIHILAAVAEDEARRISERTKVALAAAKARGIKLGNPNGARALRGKQVGNKQAVTTVRANAKQRAENLRAIVDDLKSQGTFTVRAMAAELNTKGILTPRGGTWHPTSTARLLARLSATK